MNNSERTYEALFNTGREFGHQQQTLPDNTPDLTRREREIIQSGEAAARAEREKNHA